MTFRETLDLLCLEAGITREDIDRGMTISEFAERLDRARASKAVKQSWDNYRRTTPWPKQK